MNLKTANDYQSHFSYTYPTSSCSFYYINSSESYQLPKSYIISDEEIQSRQTTNTYLHNKNHRYNNPKTSKKQLYRSMNSVSSIPIWSDDHKIENIRRSSSKEKEKHQQSLRKSSLISRRRTTVDATEQIKFFPPLDYYCSVIRDQSATISSEDLTDKLNQLTNMLKIFNNNNQYQQRLSILIDIFNALIYVRPSILASVSQNEFFSILQISFIDILHHWRHLSYLPSKESVMFRTMANLLSKVINNIDNINLLPSWLSDSALLKMIEACLTDIATSGKFLDHQNKRQFKHFSLLIDAYIDYQERLNDEDNSNKDTLVQLLDPIVRCLTSSNFIKTFLNMQVDKTFMTAIEKFFLIKCPAFLISYNGSRLQQTMNSLLSIMLPQYVKLLDKLVPAANNWGESTIRSVQYLLRTINHGANQFQINAKLVSIHLSIIDNVLKLLNEPIFYNNLAEKLCNPEMDFMNTAIIFLVKMISEPTNLAHVKQSQAANIFLRLTSCAYEPLIFNVYTLLAYTTHEEDIKAMHNPGRLLATITQSLKTTVSQESDKRTQIEQLLETLKGLVQHDQIKDEIIKQNTLPFLLECTNKLTGKPLILTFEILWCLTFFREIADALRANSEFMEEIQSISKDNRNEPLKKAVDGLVWKLIQEPAFLEKVAKQEGEDEAKAEETITTTEVIVGVDGKEKLITTTNRGGMTPIERTYEYDIMISYCHADKELTYKIHQFLIGQGFKVWIDLDNMYGPAMSAMASAVENSEFVIMCMSDSYKQSTYCQAEAEYAFKCKRRLIPLIMRRGYKPDGWLGFMIGSRIYVDFGRFDFEIACEKLITEINLQRKQPIPTIVINSLDQGHIVEPSLASKPADENRKQLAGRFLKKPPVNKDVISSLIKARQIKLNFFRKPIRQWTESDVLDFILVHHLNDILPLCEGMNGRALMQLYKMCTTDNLRAYSILKDDLKSINNKKLSVNIYSRFISLVEEAINFQLIPPESAASSLKSMNNLPMTFTSIPFVPAPRPNMSYDFLINTDVSPLHTLRMVERFGTQLQLLDSLHR